MASYTELLKLYKAGRFEFYDVVKDQNENWEKIEVFFKEFLEEKGKIDLIYQYVSSETFGKSSLGADHLGEFYLG
ncbi:MAG: hypothetical protein ACRCTS_01560 [Fusobacteriaceae bacterium]